MNMINVLDDTLKILPFRKNINVYYRSENNHGNDFLLLFTIMGACGSLFPLEILLLVATKFLQAYIKFYTIPILIVQNMGYTQAKYITPHKLPLT